jgi:Putative esterase
LTALAAIEAGLLYPRVFGKVAVMSPSVWWEQRSILEMVRRFRDGARPRLWLDSGTDEGDKPQQVVEEARLLRDALVERGWHEGEDLFYREYAGAGHNERAWRARFGRRDDGDVAIAPIALILMQGNGRVDARGAPCRYRARCQCDCGQQCGGSRERDDIQRCDAEQQRR